MCMANKKTIHVYDKDYQYLGNIMYTYTIPLFTEEQLADVIIEHFPQLKGKKWNLVFS